jgi:flagellar motility protein MotE (MotC chaperone)
MRGVLRELRSLAPFGLIVLSGMAMVGLAEEGSSSPASSPTPQVSGSPTPADSHAPAAARPRESSACLADASSVDDLRKTREELETRQKAVAAREAELAVKERALKEELKRLEGVRDEITKGGAEKKKEAEERLAKIVETVENMSPKSGAQLLAGIDEGLAVSAMTRLSTQKLSKILASMEPTRSARLTERLGGVKARPSQPVDSELARNSQSAKGGEKNYGHSETRNDAVKPQGNAPAESGREPAAVPSSNGNGAGSVGGSAGSPGAAGTKNR